MKLPPLDLLHPAGVPSTAHLSADHTDLIERTATEHGVSLRVSQVQRGAAVTRYLASPGTGVHPRKIEGVTEPLSLAVGAPVRYAGQVGTTVGLEVPNAARATVSLRSLIERGQALAALGVAVGEDVAGSPVVASLVDLPHLLVAGATGQGKSVFVNGLLLSLLMRNTPDDLSLVMIDPKRVELAPYAGLPHLLRPIVTDTALAGRALDDVVEIMEARYDSMSGAGVKKISEWNDLDGAGRWPRIVVVVDELADLMMTDKKTVESALVRIGQLGRAAGIHLVVATQYPKADVITSKLSQNIPSRIAFTVQNHVASRVILNESGAERLTGAGDALWSPVGALVPVRVQAPFVSNDEVEAVVEWWRAEAGYKLPEWVGTYETLTPEPQVTPTLAPETPDALAPHTVAPARVRAALAAGATASPGDRRVPELRDLDAELTAEIIAEAKEGTLLERVEMLEKENADLLRRVEALAEICERQVQFMETISTTLLGRPM